MLHRLGLDGGDALAGELPKGLAEQEDGQPAAPIRPRPPTGRSGPSVLAGAGSAASAPCCGRWRGHRRPAAARHQREARQIELAQDAGLPPRPRGRIDRHLDHHLAANLHLAAVHRRLEGGQVALQDERAVDLLVAARRDRPAGPSGRCPTRPAFRCRRRGRSRRRSAGESRRHRAPSPRGRADRPRSAPAGPRPRRPVGNRAASAPGRWCPSRWKRRSRRRWGRSRHGRSRPPRRRRRPESARGSRSRASQRHTVPADRPRSAGPGPPARHGSAKSRPSAGGSVLRKVRYVNVMVASRRRGFRITTVPGDADTGHLIIRAAGGFHQPGQGHFSHAVR